MLELQGEDPLAQAAKKNWLGKSIKFKSNTVKTDFYDVLEKAGFRYRSLLVLEQLQFLEKSVEAQIQTQLLKLTRMRSQVPLAEFQRGSYRRSCNMYCINGECQEAREFAKLGYCDSLCV